MKFLRLVCALCAIALCFGVTMNAQAVNGSVLGTVTDPSGAIIPNAKVTLTNTNTGATRSIDTNKSGNYSFPDVVPGVYSVAVEASGFRKETRANIDVLVNTSPRVDIQLQPGAITQSIEVTATTPLLQTDRADVESSIQRQQLANLPTGVNRNFQSLLNLVPGTTRASFQHSQFFNASSSLQTEVNGQMRQGNNYQIEGIDDNERTGLLQILVPPIAAIETVDVSTDDYDASLGRASGAVTNVILKSGTNQIHGSAYEFLQNSEFDARSFFNPSVGHIAYNYFGGAIGGPIIKNKLFYFGDILRVTDHEATSSLFTIPTMAERAGDLSNSTTTIYNPTTSNATDGTGRSPFPGNKLSPTDINPVAVKLMALLPAPNLPSANGSNNYFANLPFHKDTTSFDTKVDWNATDNDQISTRLSFARPVIFQAPAYGPQAGGPANGAFEGTGVQRTYSGGINYNHVFSPSLISVFRIGVAYYNNIATPSDYGKNDATAIGIPGANLDAFTSGMTSITGSSFFSTPILGYSASLPWIRAEANIDLANSWTKVKGNHTIQWGVDFRRIRDALLQEQNFGPRGQYTFETGQTALNLGKTSSKTSYLNQFASLLLGYPNQVGRDLDTYFPSLRAWELFTYIQDKWVVTPKLTLNLGLRWEFYPPFTPQFPGGFSNYNPDTNELVIGGVGGNPSNLGMKTQYHYFAPRFGVAYRVTNSTVVRTGFGISYTPYPDNKYANFNYPVTANNEFDAANSYVPVVLPNGAVATYQNGFPTPILVPVPSNGIIPATTPTLLNQSYFTIPLNYKNPYVESYNFTVEQALPDKFVLTAGYVGNHCVDCSVAYNLNAAVVAGIGKLGQPQIGFGRTANDTLYFAPYSAMYNSLQVKLDRRFSSGLTITTAYTYGKGMGFQGDDDGGLSFYIDQRRDYARNDFDRTHTFVQSYDYSLPFGPGKHWLNSGLMGNILGGWRVNGILTLMSGLPFTVTASGTALNTPGNTQTADQVAPVQILHGIGPDSAWFSTSSFAQPTATGVFGSSGRNAMTGPGFFDLDASLFKVIKFRERYTLELRGEALNIMNTPQFSNPSGSLTSGNFGHITSVSTSGSGVNGVGGGRALQLGATFSF